MDTVTSVCKVAKENCGYIASLDTAKKNDMLFHAAAAIQDSARSILDANARDVSEAEKNGMPTHFIDRLTLSDKRIADMADGLRALIKLPDPVGEVLESWTADSGIRISKVSVPLGVLGIIYEARPNVTIDAIGLCIKTGNSIVLRGSKDAKCSNKALVDVVKARLSSRGYLVDFMQLVPDVTREGAETLMKCREYVDVLLPRGSASLIRSVVEKSTVPVIETGAGNCHAYIEKSADPDCAERIVLNGKLQRPSVCNALESLLFDPEAARTVMPKVLSALRDAGVEIVGDEGVRAICPYVSAADESDYFAEYNALKISVKIVADVAEAVRHINKYSTHHSDVIITRDKQNADYFLAAVDSAAVYVNASTRFTDGFEFGFGAEMGISTQKLHARGPIGLRQLTSAKYCIAGDGQVRK